MHNKLFYKLGICPGDVNYPKCETFFKGSCALVANVMTRLIELAFKNIINMGSRWRSENFTGMLTCFLNSMACTNCFGQSEVAFSEKPFHERELSLVPHTIISLIRESWRLSNSHLELFNSVKKLWKFLLPVCKQLVAKNSCIFSRVTAFLKIMESRS